MQKTAEIWKPIDGYPAYEVSDHGRVRSLDRVVIRRNGTRLPIKGITLTPAKAKMTNHQFVSLISSPGEKSKTLSIHYLVLTTFVGPRPDGLQGCHNDGDPTNNHVSNLRWDTASSNVQDTIRHGNHNMASRTHCKNGHEYTEANTRMVTRPNRAPFRLCRECFAAAQREQRRKVREGILPNPKAHP